MLEAAPTRALYPPLGPLPWPLTDDQRRAELVRLRQALCQDLELTAGIILNTGILPEVPPRIQEITGLPRLQSGRDETRACREEECRQAVRDLREKVRTIEWLIRVHAAAMRDLTEQKAQPRQIEAKAEFADFCRVHDISIRAMRESLFSLREHPTLVAMLPEAGSVPCLAARGSDLGGDAS